MRLSRRLRFSSFVRNAWQHVAGGQLASPAGASRLYSTLAAAAALACLAEGPVAQVVRAHA